MTIPLAMSILRSAGYKPDEYRWLKSSSLFAFAFRVEREKKRVSGKVPEKI